MPLVKIHLRKGKSPEYIRAVADAVHDALVSHANVPADDRFQLIQEYAPDDIIAHPSYAGVVRTEDLIEYTPEIEHYPIQDLATLELYSSWISTKKRRAT